MSDSTPVPYPLSSDIGQPVTSASPAPVAGSSTVGANGPGSSQSRQAAEDARKDRTLAEFMLMLDDYEPLVSLLGKSRNPDHLLIRWICSRFPMK